MSRRTRSTLSSHLREIGREFGRALRIAKRRPTFSLVAIATLGIGVGSATATFGIADAVVTRPLPVHDQHRLAVLRGLDRAAGTGQVPVPYPAFKGFVDNSPRTLSAVAAVDYHGASTIPVRDGADGVNLKVALITGNLFSVLGVMPLLGRSIQAQDDSAGAAPVVAISYELWQRRYGRDPSVLGRVLGSRAARYNRRGDAARLCRARQDGCVGNGAPVPPRRGVRFVGLIRLSGRTAGTWRNGRPVRDRAHGIPPEQRRAAATFLARHDRVRHSARGRSAR